MVLLLASTPTSAQVPLHEFEVEVHAKATDEPVIPGSGLLRTPITVQVHCAAPSLFLFPVEIHHRIEASHAQATVALDTPSHTITTGLQACAVQPTTIEYTVEAMTGLHLDIPAGEQITLSFYTRIGDDENLSTTWTHEVALTGTWRADAHPTTIWATPGDEETVSLQMLNQYNTPLLVTIYMEHPPLHGNLLLPEAIPIAFDPSNPLQETSVKYHKQSHGDDSFTLRLIAALASEPGTILSERSLSIQVQDHSPVPEDTEAPGAIALAAPLALLAGLWLTRHRGDPRHRTR